MRLLIVGPGAIGTLFAVRLARAGHDVTVVPRARTPARDVPVQYRVEGVGPAEATVVEHIGPVGPGTADGVLVAVKGYDLEVALERVAPLRDVPILLVQNGLGIRTRAETALRRAGAMDPARWLVIAVQTLPTTRIGPGVSRQAGAGEVVLPEGSEPADRWAEWLGSAGIPVRRAPDIDREIWRKVLVNAAINPVTADHGVLNGCLAQDPWRDQARTLLREARAVAAAEGYDFPEIEAERDLFRIVRATAENRSSMLQDLDHHRPSEIDLISGAILALGEARGMTLPATRRIVERIRRKSLPPSSDAAAQG